MKEFSQEIEPLQVVAVSLEQAEQDLMAASKALDPYGSFEDVSEPILWAFGEACDRWMWAQVRAMNEAVA